MNGQLNLKFPLPVRLVVSTAWVLVVWSGVASTHRSLTTLVVMLFMTALAIHILSYRAEVTRSEVRLCYWPFFNRSILVEDVQYLTEDRTLVLVTPLSRIPLWGLSAANRSDLFHILPQRLQVKKSSKSKLVKTPLYYMKWHLRFAKIVGVVFFATTAVLIPMMKGNSLHKYWEPWGKYLLLIDMAFFVLFLFEGGMSFIYWQYLH